MCRERGLPRVDVRTGKVLLARSKARVLRLRGVIVGTHAFRCYPALPGIEIPEAGAVTEDIEQSAALIRVLVEDRPDELEDVLVEARARGPSWREAVDRGTRRLPRDARAALGNEVTQYAGE